MHALSFRALSRARHPDRQLVRFYDDAVQASECARPDLMLSPLAARSTGGRLAGRRRPRRTLLTRRPRQSGAKAPGTGLIWTHPGLLTSATACAAVLSSLALIL